MARKKKQTDQADNRPPPTKSQSVVNGKTGFLDLSAELRNEIYHLALVSPHDTRIEWRLTDDGRGRFYTVSLSGAVGSQEQTSGKGVNMLATCRQIKEEATPILYGANKFVVEWKHCLNQFTVNTLPFVRKLKIASVGYTREKHIGPFVVKLRRCILQQRLQLVKLELEYIWALNQPIVYFAQRFIPTMRAMVKKGKSVDEAIDLVEFFAEDGWHGDYKSDLESRAASDTSKLKAKLGEILRK